MHLTHKWNNIYIIEVLNWSAGQEGQHDPVAGGSGCLHGVGGQDMEWHKALPLWQTHSTQYDSFHVSPSK